MSIRRREGESVSSSARAPAPLVLLNGLAIDGVIDVEISANSYLAANRFRLTASLTATGYDAWAAGLLSVEIQIGIDDAWVSMITGTVDRVAFDLARGEVRAEGRDLTSLFIEARTQEVFENRTSSEIAATLASRQGLAAAVTPTTTLVGRDFHNDHARTSMDQHARVTTQWDLLIRLAELENFDVWVAGRTLNFAPASPAGTPLVLTPDDCSGITLERLPPLNNGLAVTVKSWDCRGQMAVSQTASAGPAGGKSYVLVSPNLTEQAAQALAQRVLSQMSQQQRSVAIEMPGDLTTLPRGVLSLANTGTDFDGTYMITEVERSLSFRHGFQQSVQARVPSWTIF
jgi:phage protein D